MERNGHQAMFRIFRSHFVIGFRFGPRVRLEDPATSPGRLRGAYAGIPAPALLL